MKGPTYRLHSDVRRRWKCAKCGRESLTHGKVVATVCSACGDGAWMQLNPIQRDKRDFTDVIPIRPRIVEEEVDENSTHSVSASDAAPDAASTGESSSQTSMPNAAASTDGGSSTGGDSLPGADVGSSAGAIVQRSSIDDDFAAGVEPLNTAESSNATESVNNSEAGNGWSISSGTSTAPTTATGDIDRLATPHVRPRENGYKRGRHPQNSGSRPPWKSDSSKYPASRGQNGQNGQNSPTGQSGNPSTSSSSVTGSNASISNASISNAGTSNSGSTNTTSSNSSSGQASQSRDSSRSGGPGDSTEHDDFGADLYENSQPPAVESGSAERVNEASNASPSNGSQSDVLQPDASQSNDSFPTNSAPQPTP